MASEEIIDLDDPRLKEVLSYPSFSEGHYAAVISELRRLAIRGIIPAGGLELGRGRLVGKGCTSVVCMGARDGKNVALKIRRVDACRKSFQTEGANQEYANSFGIGPKIYGYTENVIAMEYIDGAPLIKWLEEGAPSPIVARAVGEVLRQCYLLDVNRLDHGELSEAKRHIMVGRKGEAFIIDFGRSSRSRKCRNFTSIVNYLFFKESVSRLLKAYIRWDQEEVLRIAKDYKGKDVPSENALFELIRHIKLY